jgi:enolase
MKTVSAIDGLITLNSCGGPAVEVTVVLASGHSGVASGARPLVKGTRESPSASWDGVLGAKASGTQFNELTQRLCGPHKDQADFDRKLTGAIATIGGDVSIALSLAFARAHASEREESMLAYLTAMAGWAPSLPLPLINIFSGGIHSPMGPLPFQQVMILPTGEAVDPVSAYREGIQIYTEIEQRLNNSGQLRGYSSSSGMMATLETDEALEFIRNVIASGWTQGWAIGIDFAAEHLWDASRNAYRVRETLQTPASFAETVERLCRTHRLSYVEDPFAPCHREAWKTLKSALPPGALIVGDDLFATRTEFLRDDQELANAILLKLNQAGTLTSLVDVARAAGHAGLTLCASHRSCETDDPAICEVSVALGARLLKLGGPRRGDRTGRYNQLFRMAHSGVK